MNGELGLGHVSQPHSSSHTARLPIIKRSHVCAHGRAASHPSRCSPVRVSDTLILTLSSYAAAATVAADVADAAAANTEAGLS